MANIDAIVKGYVTNLQAQEGPQWTTPAKSTLAAINRLGTINTSVAATPGTLNNAIVSYDVTKGVLPLNCVMAANTGAITGSSITLWPGESLVDGEFSVTPYPTWNTAAGAIGTVNEFASFTGSVSATAGTGSIAWYSVVQGRLPFGLTMMSGNGAISGTAMEVGIGMGNEEPLYELPGCEWVTTGGLIETNNEGGTLSLTLSATPSANATMARYDMISGTFPWGITLVANGVLSGTYSEINPTDAEVALPGPTWVTASGSIGTFARSTSIGTVTFSATGATVYEIRDLLPYGLSMTSAGVLTGTIAATAPIQTYTFVVRAIAANGGFTDLTKTISVTA